MEALAVTVMGGNVHPPPPSADPTVEISALGGESWRRSLCNGRRHCRKPSSSSERTRLEGTFIRLAVETGGGLCEPTRSGIKQRDATHLMRLVVRVAKTTGFGR